MDWLSLIGPAMNLMGGIFGRRNASREVPGMGDYIGQTIAAQRDASTFANAAVSPESSWFRNLAGIFRESAEEGAMRGVRNMDFNERRAKAAGLRNVIGERHDESRASALMNAFQQAKIAGNQQAHQALLGASGKAAGAMGNLGVPFALFNQYGQAEADRRKDLFGSIANILKNIPWGSLGGGNGGVISPSQAYSNIQGGFGGNPLEWAGLR